MTENDPAPPPVATVTRRGFRWAGGVLLVLGCPASLSAGFAATALLVADSVLGGMANAGSSGAPSFPFLMLALAPVMGALLTTTAGVLLLSMKTRSLFAWLLVAVGVIGMLPVAAFIVLILAIDS